MQTIPEPTTPVTYYAQYETPGGDLLYGTAYETPKGYVFIDELGTPPLYADLRALHLHGIIAIADAQQAADTLAARWEHHMLTTGCQPAR